MNCKRCGWWLCERCFKGDFQNAGNSEMDDEDSAPDAREMDDEEFEMFVSALGATLADFPESFQVSDTEAAMIASAMRASESGAVGCLDDDEDAAPQPDYRMSESSPDAREMDDEEFEMFVSALGASLSDRPESFQ